MERESRRGAVYGWAGRLIAKGIERRGRRRGEEKMVMVIGMVDEDSVPISFSGGVVRGDEGKGGNCRGYGYWRDRKLRM